jgi:hypothetical protein
MLYFHHHIISSYFPLSLPFPSTSPINVDLDIEIYAGCLTPVTHAQLRLVVLATPHSPSRSYFISNSPVPIRHMDILSVIVPVEFSEHITWVDFARPIFHYFPSTLFIFICQGTGVRILANYLLPIPPFPIKTSGIKCFPRPSGPLR